MCPVQIVTCICMQTKLLTAVAGQKVAEAEAPRASLRQTTTPFFASAANILGAVACMAPGQRVHVHCAAFQHCSEPMPESADTCILHALF